MADVLNLRQFRKRQKREEAETKAEDNRRLHGLSKKSKKLAKAENLLKEKRLDGKSLKNEI